MPKKKSSSPYDQLAPYYNVATNNTVIFNSYKALIGNIKDKYLLDLGCGTGNLLQYYARHNQTFGQDCSAGMLQIAKKNDKKTEYYLGDISSIKINKSFDYIVCAYDTINHLAGLKKWEKMFQSVFKHLKDDGIFIFDFNTIAGLESYHNKAYFKKIKNDFFFQRIKYQVGVCDWQMDIFCQKSNNLYKHQNFTIREYVFPTELILKELKKYFTIIKTIKEKHNRIYIKARKKRLS